MAKKQQFDISLMLQRIRRAVREYPKAALFELAGEGFDSPFELLIACLISIRTYDEVTLPVARRFFARARTATEVSQLSPAEIDELIHDCTFHERKAQQISELSRRLVQEHQGELPCDEQVMLSLVGVGPKCANLVLGIACHQPRIGVDIHVHRVTRRWGLVATRTPEQTIVALEAVLPRQYWIEINSLLVPFGKHICTGNLPGCSTCPVLEFCQQVGVTAHR